MSLFPHAHPTAVPRRARRIALAAVLLMQTSFTVGFLLRSAPGVASALSGPWGLELHVVTPDTPRYEIPASNLARGGTLSLPLSNTKDPVVYGWVCSRHPRACLPDGTHPTTLYPPGYSLFVALVYAVVGEAPFAVVGLQYVMLMLLLALFEVLAARMLPRVGYLFFMFAAGTYPFLAMYAVQLSSDFLHVVLYGTALSALLLMPPGWTRGLIFGLVFSMATLVRPYSLVVFPVVWAWWPIWGAAKAPWRERATSAAAFALPLVLWALRNAYWFGRFLPMTTLGPGLVLMHTTLSWETSAYSQDAGQKYYEQLAALAGAEDVATFEASQRLMKLALERIKHNPEKFASAVVRNVPKLWISIGSTRAGVSSAWPLLVTCLGAFLILGVAGMWLRRRDPAWQALILSICVYWAFMLYSTGEARRTLPLRLPMLIAASSAVAAIVEKRGWAAQRREVAGQELG